MIVEPPWTAPRDEVAPRGADRPLQVDPVVLVEARVLDGDHRVPEVRRHLPQRDDRTVDRAVERREFPVAIRDERRLDRRERLREVDAHVGDRGDGEPEEPGREGGQHEGPPVATEEPLLPRGRRPFGPVRSDAPRRPDVTAADGDLADAAAVDREDVVALPPPGFFRA